MAFDPDKYLAEKSPAFDPDAYLASTSAPVEVEKPEDQSIFRQVADVPLQFGTGVAQSVRFITDAFGADNAVSQNIRGVEDYLSNLLSAQAKQDQQEVARIFQDAQDKGLGEQLGAGLRALAVSPVDFLAQGLGTAVPIIAGGLAGAALKGGTLAARAATAARVGTGVGAVGGAGITKSTIYDEVKRELEAAGVDEETADERAKLAQEYGGENLDQILLGAGLGGLAAGTGLEKVLASRILKNSGIVPKSLKTAAFAGAKEAAPEFIQAAQEQIAGNVALQREGFEDIPTMRGVASAAALEGSIGFLLGAGVDVALPAQQQQEYNAARASITNEVDREREAALREEETRRAQEFIAALNAENKRRQQGQADQVNIDAEAANSRARAADIAPPTQDEVNTLATPMRGADVSNDVQFGVAYGQKIARELGDYFPNANQFSVTQGEPVAEAAGQPTTVTSPEGARIDLAKPTFIVIDSEGKRYGQPLTTFEQANATAYSLNKEVLNQNVRGAILNSLETSSQAYDPETSQRLFSYGYRTLNPDANTFSTVAINEAAETVGPKYAEALSWRQVEALPQVKKKGKVVGYEYTPEGGQTRIITGLTKAQEINKSRSQEGKAESSVFGLEETRANLGNNFSRLTKDIPIDLQTTPLSQPTLEFIRNYDAVTGRPITSFYKNAALNAVTDLLRSKNVTSKIDSAEINALSKSLIGKESVKDMDYGESRLFFKKLAGLPRFEKPTQLPVFEFKPYNRENFVKASKFIQQSNAQGVKPDRDQIIEAAGLAKDDPKIDEKITALETDLSKQGVKNTPKPLLALPAPPGAVVDLEPLRKALRSNLKGFGLQDIGLSLERNLIGPTGEIAPEGAEGMFIPAMRQVFLAVDRVDPDGSLTPEQRLNALSEIMDHEVIHATRLMDLWKPTEWSTLEKTIGKVQKPGTNQSYLQIAQKGYAARNAVVQIEEAVADMWRDYRAKRLKVAGKPQNLLERLAQFFQRLRSSLAGTGFQTYGEVLNRLETGEIGARQRGEIRTLRATEKAVAKAGRLPERLQGLVGTPAPRAAARAAAVAPAAPVAPAAATPVPAAPATPATQPAAAAPPTAPVTTRPQDFDVSLLEGIEVLESRKDVKVRMPRIPGVLEDAPILPIGDVEDSLIALFRKTNSPTSKQLGAIQGAPTKRTIKGEDGKVRPDPRDTEVKPTSMEELREMARFGLMNSEDLRWYEQFGKGFVDIVGAPNLGEATVIFGITSQQNSAEQNLADTLHIMRLAREIDPVTKPKEFENAVRNKPRPDGQRLKITGDQISRIIRMYDAGFAEAGLKTSTYMQLIQDRSENKFNPFTVQDVHMARVFGFRRKERDPKTGNLIDGSKIPGDLQYRYAQFLTSKLAEEFGISPDRMQAALWFYAKTKLSPKEKGGKPGTWPSARNYSKPEIDYINAMVNRGEFDKTQALTPALQAGIRPENAVKIVIAPYSNTAQAEQLLELARRRAPTALVSATPGNARGYGFPPDLPMEKVVEFNEKAISAITDKDGQIPFLRDLGLPHEVKLSYGTYGVLEPNIQVKMLGGTPDQAKVVANILGDALLQDAAIFGQPTRNPSRVNNFGVAVMKSDQSDFTPQELESIANSVNPDKKTDDGINFTLIQPNVLSFLDSRSFGDGYDIDTMLPEFHGNIQSLLPGDMSFEVDGYTQEGDYFGHTDYKSRIQEAWDSGSLGRSPDIFKRINDTLYKPFWNTYSKFRSDNDLGLAGSPEPAPLAVQETVVRESRRPKAQLDDAVAKAEANVAATPAMAVPLYNPGASPEALYVAQNPEQGLKLTPEEDIQYSRRNQPQYQPGVEQILDKLTQDPPAQTPAQTVINSMRMPPFRDTIDKIRQNLIFNYSRLEFYNKAHPSLMHNTAAVSSLAAAEFADRSKAIFASAVKSGVPVYENGGFTVKPFIHNGREYKNGLIDVLAPLYNNPYGISLERLAQGYAIARRGQRLTREGKVVPGDPADFPQLLAEVRRYTNPETGNSIIEDWFDTWQAYNSNTVKFLRDTGMIDDAGAQLWLQQSDYFPFYRTDKTGKDISHPKVFGGLTSVTNLKALKGGEEAIDVPLMEAILSNLDSAIAMGMKNVAQQRIVRDMITIGLGRMVQPGQNIEGRPAVTFKIGGKKYAAFIDDPLIFESMQAVPEVEMDGMLGNLFRVPATVLRELIIREPGYMVANMLRDTASVVLTSGSNIIPVVDTARNFASGLENLEKFGVVGGYDFARDPKDVVKFVSDEARKRGHEFPIRDDTKWDQIVNSRYLRPLTTAWDLLGLISDKAEASTRNAVYQDTLSRTGDWVQAAYDALSVINYGRRGRNPQLRIITVTVPFLNARIQGLDKLYQAATGRSGVFPERKKNVLRFVTRAGLMVGLTGLYYATVSDDELYKNENPEVKDNYYILPITKADLANKEPGFAVKIPIPFEVGVLFKVIPERIMDSYYKDAPAKDLQNTLTRAATSTFAFNPIPQTVLPIFEVVANYDFFTGRAIVPQYMQNRDAIAQARFGTNELARMLGEATRISPLKLDHMMNGYLGSLGTYTLDVVDNVLRDNDRAYPERKWFEYPFVRRFFTTAMRPGLQEQFYELDNRVNGVVQSMNALKKEGRTDELQAYIMENQNILALKKGVSVLDKMVTNYRDQKNAVLRMDIDPEEKRRIIDELDRGIALQLKVIPELRRFAYREPDQARE